MKLSALEIKQQSFAKSMRGYDVAEVQSFLNVISNEWEHLSNKCKDQEREIQRLSEKLTHYQKVEEALHETLQTAKQSAQERVDSSKQEAQNRIAKANLEAERIIQDARHERQSVRRSIQRLLERRYEIIRGMQSYLDMASESLASFKNDDAHIYAIPAEDEYDNDFPSSQSSKTNDFSKKPESSSQDEETEDLDDLVDDLDDK